MQLLEGVVAEVEGRLQRLETEEIEAAKRGHQEETRSLSLVRLERIEHGR